ncbi:hypothetical protein WDU94_007578 [Cyamophila willieti]
MSDMTHSMAHASRIATAMKSAETKIENELFPLWFELYGTDGTIINERCETVKDAVSQLVEEMIREEQDNKLELTAKYDSLLQEANTLESELSIVVARTMGTDSQPLCVKIRNLEQDLEQHRTVKQERLSRLRKLQDEETKLCSQLEESTQYTAISTVPSESQLEEITSYVQSLAKELASRQKKYQTLFTEVTQLWTSLQLKPEGEFQIKLYQNELANKLGSDNLDHLSNLKVSLEETRNAMALELESLRYTLSTLWNRLETKSNEREKFIVKNNKLNTSTIEQFKKEIQVCQALKLKHIQKIVGSIRTELQDWWTKAHIGDAERQKFELFTLTDNITEEVLEAHEREVENMKQYYEENRDILDLLEKRFELWDEMIDLENKANDKERLFNNRGGQLLIEEKKRKFIQKELPKIEKALDKLFDRYEAAHDGVFLYDGEDARSFLAAQWEGRNSAKENNKKARKNVVSGSQPASKSKLLCPTQNVTARHTPGRNATLKRKAGEAGHAVVESPKRGRLLEPTIRKQNAPRTPGSTAVKKPLVGGSSPASSVLSYSLFQRNITLRKNARSSSLSRRSVSLPRIDEEAGAADVNELPISSSSSLSSVLRSSQEVLSIENQIEDSSGDSVNTRNRLNYEAIFSNSSQKYLAIPVRTNVLALDIQTPRRIPNDSEALPVCSIPTGAGAAASPNVLALDIQTPRRIPNDSEALPVCSIPTGAGVAASPNVLALDIQTPRRIPNDSEALPVCSIPTGAGVAASPRPVGIQILQGPSLTYAACADDAADLPDTFNASPLVTRL